MKLGHEKLTELVGRHVRIADDITWNRFTSIPWEQIKLDVLTEKQRSAVAFITFIEDHLPGYFTEYNKIFSIDEDTPLEECIFNREVYHFLVRWAQEEDRHAHVLVNYQLKSGLAAGDEFHTALTQEGRKKFTIEFNDPAQIFTYALIQEKATYLYYNQLRNVIEEPVLKIILLLLAKDEARHLAFFAGVVGAYIEQFGERMIPHIKIVLDNFKMPLYNTLDNYWRRALIISDAAGGYDHTLAYEELVKVIKRFADTSTRSKSVDIVDLVQKITAI
jgi:hypothetical protein